MKLNLRFDQVLMNLSYSNSEKKRLISFVISKITILNKLFSDRRVPDKKEYFDRISHGEKQLPLWNN